MQEIAERLGVPERTVRYWLKIGHLNGERWGREWMVTKQEVERVKTEGPPKKGWKLGKPRKSEGKGE